MNEHWSTVLAAQAPAAEGMPPGPAYCGLSDYAVLRVSGADAATFLQGQATCDVAALPPGGVTHGAFCTPKGRAIASFRMLRQQDAFHLLLPAELASDLRKRLQIFVLRAKVVIEDISASLGCIGILNAGAGADWQAVAARHADADEESWLVFPAEAGKRWLLAAAAENAERLWHGLGEEPGFTAASAMAWRLAEIEAGIPAIVQNTREEFLPQMLNLDLLGGIGYQKGCYTGQEIVARTHYLGQLKRRMFRLRCRSGTEPHPGHHIYDADKPDSRNIGQVIAVAGEADGSCQLLAVITLDHAGGNLHLQSPDGPSLAILDLPYSWKIG